MKSVMCRCGHPASEHLSSTPCECRSCDHCPGFALEELKPDAVNHPAHYTSHPSGIECIAITEHMGFNLGNALKYVWRADLKGDAIEDLKKARWYIDRELGKRGAS